MRSTLLDEALSRTKDLQELDTFKDLLGNHTFAIDFTQAMAGTVNLERDAMLQKALGTSSVACFCYGCKFTWTVSCSSMGLFGQHKCPLCTDHQRVKVTRGVSMWVCPHEGCTYSFHSSPPSEKSSAFICPRCKGVEPLSSWKMKVA